MLEFIHPLKWEKITGLIDTEEKVAEARRILESSTEASFEELKTAKMNSWRDSVNIILD